MKSLKEKIEDKCIHFNGLQNKECEAGVKYDYVKSNFKFPCLKNCEFTGGVCNKSYFKTPDEVEQEIKEIEEVGAQQMKAYLSVKKHIQETGQRKGKIECTSCGGDLHYTQAKLNGHIWGKCKCGISWIE